MPTPEETMFREAISAVNAGERSRARDLFTRLLKIRQDNPDYWLWMSSVVETQRERLYCLNEVTKLDPQNAAARRGLMIAGSLDMDETQVVPRKVLQRNWEPQLFGSEEPEKALAASSLRLTIGVAVGLVIVVAVAVVGIMTARRPTYGVVYVTHEPTEARTATPEPSFTPAAVAAASSPTPTLSGPAPLWMQLKATYTPTPLYVNTPHAVSEAYRIAMRAYTRTEWESVKKSMAQVATLQPDAADVVYYMAEASRFQKNYPEALSYYNQAISVNANFAPAYLGRARTRLAVDPSTREEPMADLKLAIEKDPRLADAYLELAGLQVADGQYQLALDTLDKGQSVASGSPLSAMYRSSALIRLGKPEEALKEAQAANQADITLLPVYRTLAEAYLANKQPAKALDALKVFLTYVSDDAAAYVLQAQAYQASGDAASALKAYDQALALDKKLPGIYQARGELNFQLKNYDQAQIDFEAILRTDKKNWSANMQLGRVYFAQASYGSAYNQFEVANGLAETPQQKAEVLYWRAQSLEILNYPEPALRDYKALMVMKTDVAKAEWISFAATKAVSIVTPTRTPVTPSATASRPPSATLTPSRTATATRTASPTLTPTKTATPKP